ncbi:hypothetical protein CHLNCDRAFT_138561 [Chlorella variabilis]|uniref:Leucine-rich repeat-containing N-terminal plant-type domain-containing protein n=1 Tax=Chlorella variabilis TaxID=554065 RepID=E1ZNA3_CHLVA|nr:hypothetical protein CHLNCDRAFT_138561 [Chlorella variabilis]EFN52567.1 hypothetical protein CHLNCDRAFT_138561 [Chlorella variabilis]|eukprot:XP_005844669.1 hypothetical protein CHLNCDRAFT_138561 [Chlorella variabilis]
MGGCVGRLVAARALASLLALCLLHAAAQAADAGADSGTREAEAEAEVSLMRSVRQALYESHPGLAYRLEGWHPADNVTHPCDWNRVWCNADRRIAVLRAVLTLAATGTGCAPLPDVAPGALPSLVSLLLAFPGLSSTLPASWGAAGSVLPSLARLEVQLELTGPLPAAWALGFPLLTKLTITGADPTPPRRKAPVGCRLPIDGPLGLYALDLSGHFPLGWSSSGFPALKTL